MSGHRGDTATAPARGNPERAQKTECHAIRLHDGPIGQFKKVVANKTVTLFFEQEGLFGTVAGHADDRIQTGKKYLIHPANFGKMWLGGNIEILEIKPRH